MSPGYTRIYSSETIIKAFTTNFNMKIISIVAARPNFMKIAPLAEAFKKYPKINPLIVHTGQHYDDSMSNSFFLELGIPKPDINLNVGSKSYSQQTAEIMINFEKVLLENKPYLVIVVGDVNSTIACALVASKLGIKVAHVEAGLRSFDKNMPGEINRILTDQLSDFLFVTEKDAIDNLVKEGIDRNKIHFVGNVMIDTLLKNKKKAKQKETISKLNLNPQEFILLTLHRPSNVDYKEKFEKILESLEEISKKMKIILPLHPRTKNNAEKINLLPKLKEITTVIEPLSYLDNLNLMMHSKRVLTDSGSIQEETTILGVPYLTLRENTERPVTVKEGTNKVIGTNKDKIIEETLNILNNVNLNQNIPELWDGKASERIT